MNDGSNKRKLNPESVSPEAHQTKKRQGGSSPNSQAADELVKSLPGEVCDHCKKECTSESKAL